MTTDHPARGKAKQRIDVLLVERGLAPSRERAQALIMAGVVYSGDVRMEKPGTKVDPELALTVRTNPNPYVSRGGLKLEKALEKWPIALAGKICMDIGASTGGFTDCMLQKGARYVYAVDVGYGQLDWRLRQDPRVCSMERTNIRHLSPDALDQRPEFVSIDVSFISTQLVFPVVSQLMAPRGEMVFLIKPQFEAGREQVKKHGVVRDADVHGAVIEKTLGYAAQCGFAVRGVTYSPITGPKGNIEFLAWAVKCAEEASAALSAQIEEGRIGAVVSEAHRALREG